MSQMQMDEIGALKVRVAELEEKIEMLYKHLGIPSGKKMTEMNAQIANLIRQQKIIEAIKLYRELTNTGLAEAKVAVEAMATQLGVQIRDRR